MAKKAKEEKDVTTYACDNCIYFTDKCENPINIEYVIKDRIETKTYKTLEKKAKCKCLVKAKN